MLSPIKNKRNRTVNTLLILQPHSPHSFFNKSFTIYTQTPTPKNQMKENEKQTMGSSLMENSPPFVLRNLVSSAFIYADKSFFYLSERYKLLKIIRYLLIVCFLFFLKFIPSNLLSLQSKAGQSMKPYDENDGVYGRDSGIARALSQLLSSVNDIPVSSRKYEIVRSLAERLIEDNDREAVRVLREVNRTVLSAAFSKTARQLEGAMAGLGCGGPVQNQMIRVLRAVRSRVGTGVMMVDDLNRSGNSAEKLAAELLWLAQKLAACGFGFEAVERWASASNLAELSLLAEQRLQGSLVKVSAFLFMQASNTRVVEEESEEGNKEKSRQTKMKMMTSWLPLLCRASNGDDVPVLSIGERAELEKVLEEAIEKLDGEEQERVLSLWLHHFTYCPSSDWPNLYASYARWCATSRKLVLLG